MVNSIIVATGSYIPPAIIPNTHFLDNEFYDNDGHKLERSNADIIKKLEEIIERIESEDIDVDELSAKVKEAVTLIKTCKNKIEKAELEVKKVVDGFDDQE